MVAATAPKLFFLSNYYCHYKNEVFSANPHHYFLLTVTLLLLIVQQEAHQILQSVFATHIL